MARYLHKQYCITSKRETARTVNDIRQLSEKRTSTGVSMSGQGMDRRVEKGFSPYRTAGIFALLLLMAGFAWWLTDTLLGGRSLSVDAGRIAVSEVTVGTFEDFIPLRGRLMPRRTVYLDAIEGGRVERVLVEDGARVAAGEMVAELSNTNLQLVVLGREAEVAEQLNFMRTLELQLEQNRLSHKKSLVEIDYQIVRLTRSIERQRGLASENLVSQSTIEEIEDELNYYHKRRDITLESQATDARLQEQQLRQLRESGQQLQASLEYARKNLADLNITAPIAGELSGFDIEVGQSIERGGRLGQIDDPDAYKLNVRIDEYYLGRVDLQQTANVQFDGGELPLEVAKIYPQVKDGQFEVDMLFEKQPEGLKRGQTLQLRLTLGDNSDALLIPNGAFYQETGGNWLFVVSPDGSEAVRRTVRLGRRNTEYIEVLDGLEAGEKVVTSPYTGYGGLDRLALGGN
jgi:HlyD family secretion protein